MIEVKFKKNSKHSNKLCFYQKSWKSEGLDLESKIELLYLHYNTVLIF